MTLLVFYHEMLKCA